MLARAKVHLSSSPPTLFVQVIFFAFCHTNFLDPASPCYVIPCTSFSCFWHYLSLEVFSPLPHSNIFSFKTISSPTWLSALHQFVPTLCLESNRRIAAFSVMCPFLLHNISGNELETDPASLFGQAEAFSDDLLQTMHKNPLLCHALNYIEIRSTYIMNDMNP